VKAHFPTCQPFQPSGIGVRAAPARGKPKCSRYR
jgi:hypothetical protein